MEIVYSDCPHCKGTGTCIVNQGASCGTCLKKASLKSDDKLVRCEVCEGHGKIAPKSEIVKNRIPVLIVGLVLGVFYVYAGMNAKNPETFNQIFPLVGSLTTMIVTFYFSKK
jgi:hypothetical protein